MLSELFRLDKIMGVCENICYFFVVNLMFLFSCLPVLLFFLFVGISQAGTYLPLFLLCLTSVAPALSAVFYAMRRLLDGRERGAVRDYVQGYRCGFFTTLGLGALQMAMVFILWTNFDFFSHQVEIRPLVWISGILLVLVVLLTPNLYLLTSRYVMSIKQLIKTSCILTIARPVYTLGSIAALGVLLAAFEMKAGITVLFMGSAYGFLIVFMSRRLLQEIETEE